MNKSVSCDEQGAAVHIYCSLRCGLTVFQVAYGDKGGDYPCVSRLLGTITEVCGP